MKRTIFRIDLARTDSFDAVIISEADVWEADHYIDCYSALRYFTRLTPAQLMGVYALQAWLAARGPIDWKAA